MVESEIPRNTQWHIFHIFTSEDIDHVTLFMSIVAFAPLSQFATWQLRFVQISDDDVERFNEEH
jgi:hypothetical protein